MSVESARAFCMRLMSDDEFRDGLGKVTSAEAIRELINKEYEFNQHDLLKAVSEYSREEIKADKLEAMICEFYQEELASNGGNPDAVKYVSEWFKSL